MTGTASEFGVQFDSMADVISFGMAPAVLAFAWGLSAARAASAGPAAFLFVTAAALRLARFNIQAPPPPTSGTSSACPARRLRAILAATVFAYPDGLVQTPVVAAGARCWCVVPALLMVSTVRFRSFKTIDLQARRPFRVLIVFAAL